MASLRAAFPGLAKVNTHLFLLILCPCPCPYPWLVSSEWLHYGYAILMLIGLFVLRGAFVGRAAGWWMAALVIQFWHHLEHLLLLIQAQTGHFLFGRSVPTSILQLVWPRIELHLFYNTVVFIPMVVAVAYHLRPSRAEAAQMTCNCVTAPLAQPVT